MKTIQTIRQELAEAGKPVSVAQLYRYFRRFKIEPVARLRPVLYASDVTSIILDGLGIPVGTNLLRDPRAGSGTASATRKEGV